MSLPKLNPSKATSLGIDWARWLRAGDRVVCAQMTGEPRMLVADLAATLAVGAAPPPAALFLGTPFSAEAAAMPTAVALEVWGGMGAAAAMMRERALTVYPVAYSRSPELFASGAVSTDVVLVSLALHPTTGRLHLAPAHGYVLEAARRARYVIAEVNLDAPSVRGAEWPDDLVPAFRVEVRSPLAVAPEVRATPIDHAIGAHVASCVPDGASIQIGIGAVASAVVTSLEERRRLIVRSGLYTSALHALVRSGAVEPRRTAEPAVVCSAVYGTPALYAEVHDCDDCRIAPPATTHALASLAALPRFTAINGALEVDLFGQINAESVGGRYVGGVGGLNDFVRGALACPGGVSIVAIPARRRVGHRDAAGIVVALSGPATVSASDADIFVSEHGVARVRGLSRAGRAHALIGIAHPDDRPALLYAARQLGLA